MKKKVLPEISLIFPSCPFSCGTFGGKDCLNQFKKKSKIALSAGQQVKHSLAELDAGQTNPFEYLAHWEDLQEYMSKLRHYSDCIVKIYTPYTREEFGEERISWLSNFSDHSIIEIHFAKLLSNDCSRYRDLVGSNLGSIEEFIVI